MSIPIPFRKNQKESFPKRISSVNCCITTTFEPTCDFAGAYLPAVTMLLVVPVAGCDRTAVMALMVLTVGLIGFTASGFGVNHIDIGPNFAGTLMGITNMGSNTMGFVAPWIVGLVTEVHQDLDHWHTVYCIAAAILFAGNTFYIVFVSGEEQAFNRMGVLPDQNGSDHNEATVQSAQS